MTKVIAITIGDINGIGIDILIKTWEKKQIKNFILFSNINIFKKHLRKRKIKSNYNLINENTKNLNFIKKKINVFSYEASSLEENTYKSLEYAYDFCIKKICIGIITLPIRKDLIKKKINRKFIGHTEFFQNIDKKKHANMILYHKKLIVSPLSTHIEVKNISKIISKKNFLYNQIFNLYKCLQIDFSLKKPKMIISGLNPHAGENGEIGIEEKKIIIPILKKLKINGIKIDGPLSADSMLLNQNLNKYDCFIFMYHDQALIPFKYISKFSGVNYTGSLSIIRTSPDHGTAYNLVGSNDISNKSFINCYKLVNTIYKNRTINDKS